jgi:hypothetical protein
LPEFDDIPASEENPTEDSESSTNGGGAGVAFIPDDQHMRLTYFTSDVLVGDY